MSKDLFTSSRLKTKNKGKKAGSMSRLSNKKLTELSEVEEALRSLELTENSETAKSCSCAARKHPLNSVTPNCLNCGQIICMRNSSSVCSFCHEKLLSNDELQAILAVLREEKASIELDGTAAALDKANSTLNRLLDYQDSSAVRTHIIDQASDFDLPGAGPNKWATATEQAEQLKKQQRMLKKQQKRNDRMQGRGGQVLSIDLKGNKVVMRAAREDEYSDSDSESESEAAPAASSSAETSLKAPKSKKLDKKLISPSYSRLLGVGIDHDSVRENGPVRLQEPEEDAYFEF
jgi:hypothetical protein